MVGSDEDIADGRSSLTSSQGRRCSGHPARLQPVERVPHGEPAVLQSGGALDVAPGADDEPRHPVAAEEQEVDLAGAVVERAPEPEGAGPGLVRAVPADTITPPTANRHRSNGRAQLEDKREAP